MSEKEKPIEPLEDLIFKALSGGLKYYCLQRSKMETPEPYPFDERLEKLKRISGILARLHVVGGDCSNTLFEEELGNDKESAATSGMPIEPN